MSEASKAAVIVGAGQAGSDLALELRRLRWPGPITLIGDEPHLPYQRPPLSKAMLLGEAAPESLLLKGAQAYAKGGITVRTGQRVAEIDRVGHHVILSSGKRIPYAKLGLALGGHARELRVPGHLLRNIHYLRTIEDAQGLRDAFVPGRRLVIVGGGYVGLEVASAAKALGLQVTVLESAPRVLARVTAPALSTFYEEVHRAEGVLIRTGSTVVRFEGTSMSAVRAVICGDGEELPADIVLVGIGLVPNTALAEECGLVVEDGILVDERQRTADPDIVAAGDCVRFHSAFLERWTRLESVPNAMEQARTAAATLCGAERPYTAAPWFWSEQYGLKLQMVGVAQDYDATALRGSMAGRAFIVFYLKEGRIIAADSVNRLGEFMTARRLVDARVHATPERLADESAPLKALLQKQAA